MLVKGIATAEADLEDGAVFALPLDFDGFEARRSVEAGDRGQALAKIENDLRAMVGGKKIRFGIVAKHGQESLVDGEKLSRGIAAANTVGGIVHQGAVEGLRVAQGFFRVFQFGAQSSFVEDAANSQGQLRDMFAFHELENTLRGDLRKGFHANVESQEDQGDLLDHLMKELQTRGALEAGTGEFGDDDIVGLREELSLTLG